MAGVIVRRVQSIVRKPVALLSRLVAPQPAVTDFFDFFARDGMTIFIAAAVFGIPGMSGSGAIE